jgi:hypothetical protein
MQMKDCVCTNHRLPLGPRGSAPPLAGMRIGAGSPTAPWLGALLSKLAQAVFSHGRGGRPQPPQLSMEESAKPWNLTSTVPLVHSPHSRYFVPSTLSVMPASCVIEGLGFKHGCESSSPALVTQNPDVTEQMVGKTWHQASVIQRCWSGNGTAALQGSMAVSWKPKPTLTLQPSTRVPRGSPKRHRSCVQKTCLRQLSAAALTVSPPGSSLGVLKVTGQVQGVRGL